MALSKLLAANRGEIAIRIVRAAADHGRRSVNRWATKPASAP